MLNRWFPTIEAQNDARKLTRQGAIGVLVFAAMYIGGALYAYLENKSPSTGGPLETETLYGMIISWAISVGLLLVFAWRIYRGKGWVSAGFALAWFVFEIFFKVSNGTTNVVWIVAYASLGGMIANGMRGCWWLRKFALAPAPTH